MHGINTKAKEDTSSERAPRERHVQNYDAKDNRHKAREERQEEDVEKSVLRALCLVASLRICGERVQRWRLLRVSFYYPSYDTKSVRLSVPSPVQDKAATTVCISCDALLFVK